jgi:hypothetical protein
VVDNLRAGTVGWLKYLPVVGSLFMFFDDSMKKTMDTLEGLEEDISVEGSALASAVDGMKSRLTTPDAQRIYLGVDARRV